MLDEIRMQPESINETIQYTKLEIKKISKKLDLFRQGIIKRIIFTGMGSSFYATYPSLIQLNSACIPCNHYETSELLYNFTNLDNDESLIIVVSQSGDSAEITHLTEAFQKAHLIGVSNNPNGNLALRVPATFLIHAGIEQSVATKTYTATLVALQFIVDYLLLGSIDSYFDMIKDTPTIIENSIELFVTKYSRLIESSSDFEHIIILGRGYSITTTNAGALLFQEGLGIPALSLSSAQFRHGPIEILNTDKLTIFILGGIQETLSLNFKLFQELLTIQKKDVFWLSHAWNNSLPNMIEIPKVQRKSLLPLVEIIPLQIITAMKQQLNPKQQPFRYAQKITRIE